MAKQSRFEKANKMVGNTIFNIPATEGCGCITSELGSDHKNHMDGDIITTLRLHQERSLSTIYLDQEQGAELAKQLSHLFLVD